MPAGDFIGSTARRIMAEPEAIAEYSTARLRNVLEYAEAAGLDDLAGQVTRELRMQAGEAE